jgi:hypothetical protein
MFNYEVYLELAVDGEPAPQDVQTTEGQPSETVTEPAVPPTPQEIEIDGEKYTVDQLKEYKKGYLRQSDYTKKTQEIASQKKEAQDAIELYNFFKQNPEYLQKFEEIKGTNQQQTAPKIQVTDPATRELMVKVKTMEIDNILNEIKKDDPDLNEVELMNYAYENNMDVQHAYYAMRGMNFNKILEKKLAEQSARLTAEMKKNAGLTGTLINPGDSTKDTTFGLSKEEITMASKLNMTPEEYAKWRT